MWLPRRHSGKEFSCQCRRHNRRRFDPWVGKMPWRRKGQPTPVFLPRKFHGQRSLAGYKSIGSQRVRHNWACTHMQKPTRPSLIKQTSIISAAAAAKSLQSCLTLCDPIDGSPPGSPVPGILQARTLEWDAISFSNAWKWKVKMKSLSRVRLLATPWTAAYQAPPPIGFPRQPLTVWGQVFDMFLFLQYENVLWNTI